MSITSNLITDIIESGKHDVVKNFIKSGKFKNLTIDQAIKLANEFDSNELWDLLQQMDDFKKLHIDQIIEMVKITPSNWKIWAGIIQQPTFPIERAIELAKIIDNWRIWEVLVRRTDLSYKSAFYIAKQYDVWGDIRHAVMERPDVINLTESELKVVIQDTNNLDI